MRLPGYMLQQQLKCTAFATSGALKIQNSEKLYSLQTTMWNILNQIMPIWVVCNDAFRIENVFQEAVTHNKVWLSVVKLILILGSESLSFGPENNKDKQKSLKWWMLWPFLLHFYPTLMLTWVGLKFHKKISCVLMFELCSQWTKNLQTQSQCNETQMLPGICLKHCSVCRWVWCVRRLLSRGLQRGLLRVGSGFQARIAGQGEGQSHPLVQVLDFCWLTAPDTVACRQAFCKCRRKKKRKKRKSSRAECEREQREEERRVGL